MSVGMLATGLDLATLGGLTYARVPVRIASVVALSLGVVLQFAGNKWFAFRDNSAAWVKQGGAFLGVEALGFAANLVLFDVAVRALPAPILLVRMITTSIVYFALCLPLWSLIFKRQEAP
jgi:putative flippase GtrA